MSQIKTSDITKIGGFKNFGFIEITACKKRYMIRLDELTRILQATNIVFDVEPLKGRSKTKKISERGLCNLDKAPDKFKIALD